MRKKIHLGRVTTLVLLSLSVLTVVHGQDVPAKNGEGGEVQALKQELAEQKQLLEELRLVVLDQKKQLDGIKQQQASAPAPAATKGAALIASAAPFAILTLDAAGPGWIARGGCANNRSVEPRSNNLSGAYHRP